MFLQKAFKFKLKVTPEISQKFMQYSGCCRFIFNKLLEKKVTKLGAAGSIIIALKAENDWLKLPPAQALQQAAKNLETAFKRFYKGESEYPVFKKKFKKDSFRIPQGFKVDENNCVITLPKIGNVKYFKSQKISGKVKNLTISREVNNWFVSIQTEQNVEDPIHPFKDKVIGLDLGVKNLLVGSDNSYEKPINSYRKLQKRIARLNQIVSRKQKGSRNQNKIYKKRAILYKKSGNIRKDFQHKLTTKIANNHGIIVVEALNISNMLQTGSALLNKGLLDQGLYEIKRQLKYKSNWLGGTVIEIDPAYTSQTCNVCGVLDKKSRITRDLFKCVACGNESCADYNASKNILLKGLHLLSLSPITAVGNTVTNINDIPKALEFLMETPEIKSEPILKN